MKASMMPYINTELAQDLPTNPPSPGNPFSQSILPNPSLSCSPTPELSLSQSHPISISTTLLHPPKAGPFPAETPHPAQPAPNSKPSLQPKSRSDAPKLGSHYPSTNTHTKSRSDAPKLSSHLPPTTAHTSPLLHSNSTPTNPSKIPSSSRPSHHIIYNHDTASTTEEFEPECEPEHEDLPPGFPYTDWRGVWSFAWEYVRGMRGLVTEWMEGTGRYGPVRHTT